MKKIISKYSMNQSSLEKLSKSQLIKLLLQLNAKSQSRKPIPTPRKSVKQMVYEYEDNIILPPLEFRDDYKPIPTPRTKLSNEFNFDDTIFDSTSNDQPLFKITEIRNTANKKFNAYTNEFKINILMYVKISSTIKMMFSVSLKKWLK